MEIDSMISGKHEDNECLHVIPFGHKNEDSESEPIHKASDKCWCYPLMNDGVFIHNSAICLESCERQGIEHCGGWIIVAGAKNV